MELVMEFANEDEGLTVPEIVVPGLTTCGSSACSSTCCCCPSVSAEAAA